jgi:ABC-type branched-subunit amino acid transport system substrate-binding protein
VNGELKALFKQQVDSVLVPSSTTDITSAAAAAVSKHPDAIALAIPQNLSVSAIDALRSQGYQGMIVGPAEALSPAVLKHVKNPGQLYVSGSYAYSSPAFQTFLSDMAKYQSSAETNDYALSAWVGMREFADVMSKSTEPLTRAGVIAAFSSLSGYTMEGLIPPLDYTKPNPVKSFARLVNMTQVLHQVKGTETTDVQPVEFIDTLTGQVVPAN